MRKVQRTLLATYLVSALLWVVTGPAAAYPVAGVEPSQRPADAPVIRELEKGEAWYRRAVFGISTPYPSSLRFLDQQGAWHTPFNHPGMTAPYDIRGWHGTGR